MKTKIDRLKRVAPMVNCRFILYHIIIPDTAQTIISIANISAKNTQSHVIEKPAIGYPCDS